MRMPRIVLALACLLCAVVWQASAQEPKPPSLLVDVNLTDGSRLLGTAVDSALILESLALGRMSVPLSAIQEINRDPRSGRADITLWDGNQLSGSLDNATLELDTLAGRVRAPLRHAAYISIFDPARLQRGLIAQYNFDGDLAEAAGRAAPAKGRGVAFTADRTGRADGALLLDDKDDYVDLGAEAGAIQRAFSIACRVRLDHAEGEMAIFGSASPGAWSGRRIGLGTSGVSLSASRDQFIQVAFPDEPFAVGEWVALAAVWNGEQVQLYVNGCLCASDAWSGDLPPPTANLLGRFTPDQAFFLGALDDLRLYDRALSDTDVRELHGAGEPPPVVVLPEPIPGPIPPGPVPPPPPVPPAGR